MPTSIWKISTTHIDSSSSQDKLSKQNSSKNKLQITLFVLNPVLSKQEIDIELKRVYKDLSDIFEPWLRYYIWDWDSDIAVQDESVINFQIYQHENEYQYIHAEIPTLGQTDDDEWLITHLLRCRLSVLASHPDLFIQIYNNTEGEFLLVEGYEHIPDWINPENSKNRVWINQGNFLIIPDEYYAERSLSLKEALLFLKKVSFRCLKSEKFNQCIADRLKDYPLKAVKRQGFVYLRIPRDIAGLVMKKPSVVSSSVMRYAGKELSQQAVVSLKEEEIEGMHIDKTLFRKAIQIGKRKESVELKVKVHGLAYMFIDFQKSQLQEQHSEIDINDILTYSLTRYVQDHKIELLEEDHPSDHQILDFNGRGDELQEELIRLMIIEDFVENDFDSLIINTEVDDEPEESQNKERDNKDEQEILTKLEKFFQDEQAGLDGIDNRDRKTNGLEDSEDEDEDEENAHKFFKDNNIDIDEDDFFEFFTKEALNLNEEDLEKFREQQQKHEDGEYSELEEEEEEEKEEEYINHDLARDDDESEEDLKYSLRKLLQALKVENGGIDLDFSSDRISNGPVSSLFQAMMGPQK